MTILTTIALATLVFLATNLDNLLLLMMFFANPRFTPRQVILGNYLSGLIIILSGLLCGLAAYSLPQQLLSWFGLIPLSLGLWLLLSHLRRKPTTEKQLPQNHNWNTLTITSICLAHGADNVIAYGSLFATSSPTSRIAIIILMILMITLFTTLGHTFAHHPISGKFLKKIAPLTTPIVLISFGLWILSKLLFP